MPFTVILKRFKKGLHMNILQKICERTTHHRFRHLTGWSVGITPTEFHWRCSICGKNFWNYNKPDGFKDQKYSSEDSIE